MGGERVPARDGVWRCLYPGIAPKDRCTADYPHEGGVCGPPAAPVPPEAGERPDTTTMRATAIAVQLHFPNVGDAIADDLLAAADWIDAQPQRPASSPSVDEGRAEVAVDDGEIVLSQVGDDHWRLTVAIDEFGSTVTHRLTDAEVQALAVAAPVEQERAELIAAVRAADAEYRRVCDARLHAGAAHAATQRARIALADHVLAAAPGGEA